MWQELAEKIQTQLSALRNALSFAPPWAVSAVLLVVAVIVAWSVAMDARISTSALLLLIGVAPAVVTVLIGAGAAPSPTVAEILQSVHAKDGRS